MADTDGVIVGDAAALLLPLWLGVAVELPVIDCVAVPDLVVEAEGAWLADCVPDVVPLGVCEGVALIVGV